LYYLLHILGKLPEVCGCGLPCVDKDKGLPRMHLSPSYAVAFEVSSVYKPSRWYFVPVIRLGIHWDIWRLFLQSSELFQREKRIFEETSCASFVRELLRPYGSYSFVQMPGIMLAAWIDSAHNIRVGQYWLKSLREAEGNSSNNKLITPLGLLE
jgi:hypothetical protein